MVVLRFPAPHDTTRHCTPKTQHLYRRHAPKKAPCPHCGKLGRRKQTLARTVRSLAYQTILLLHVTTAEYRASCDCCTTFRTQIDGIEPKAHYHNKVRDAVLDRLLDDRMTIEGILQAMQRDFFLDLSCGFIYDTLRWKISQLDMAAYRQWTLEQFSGTLCIDEIHLGDLTLLLATDPLADFPVAFALVSANDQEHMGRFLRQLRAHGFHPRVVVTDGSNLYPALLAEIWPATAHQLCVFHVLQDIHKEVLEAVRRLRRQQSRRGNCGRKRSRGSKRRTKANRRHRPTLKEKAHFIFKHRYLLVQRRDHLGAKGRQDLQQLLEYLPGLRVLRRFVDDVQQLLTGSQTEAQAWVRYEALQQEKSYAAVPELAAVLQSLTREKFGKMIAFLRSPLGRRVRTNNHVERMNRQLRGYEKVRYRWRTGRGIVGFVVLLLERRWRGRQSSPAPARSRPNGAMFGPSVPIVEALEVAGRDGRASSEEAA